MEENLNKENSLDDIDVMDIERDKNQARKENNSSNFLKDWVLPIVLALFLGFLVNKWLIMKIEVPSGSMEPTIMTGDKLFVTKVYKPSNLKRGDIVVFYTNIAKRKDQSEKDYEENRRLIKRLIGLPGDKVSLKHGVLYINGKLIEEPYVKNQEDFSKEFEVPQGKYLFFGDNRSSSFDARKWPNPYIDAESIIAKAGLRVAPFKNFGFVK